MVCFCKNMVVSLQAALVVPKVSVTARATVQLGVAEDMLSLAQWLARFGLPAAPWQPDLAWLQLRLPPPPLAPSAMTTLSAFAQLRASAMLLGIDPLVPAQAMALTRLAATVTQRLAVLVADPALAPAIIGQNAQAWSQLSATLVAVDQVQAALALGLFPTPPAGTPLAPWRGFLRQLRGLLPMIALCTQLGLTPSVHLAESLAVSLRTLAAIAMPAIPPASLRLMASLTATFSAMAQVRLSLGIDPVQLGLPAVQAMVTEQVTRTAQTIRQSLGLTPAALLALLPRVFDYCPTLMAPPAVVQAAMRLDLPPITWQVPAVANVPVLAAGLPVASFAGQLQTALSLSMAARPCANGCDAAALAKALSPG